MSSNIVYGAEFCSVQHSLEVVSMFISFQFLRRIEPKPSVLVLDFSKSAEVCFLRSLWLIVRIISFRQDSHVMSGRAKTPTCRWRKMFLLRVSGVRVFQIGRTFTLDLARFRFLDITSSSLGTTDLKAFLKNVFTGLSKFPPEPNQEHRFLAPEDWQLEFSKQVSQSACG